MQTDDANRWARIRDLLTPAEATLIFNACQDKARGDREAARSVTPAAQRDSNQPELDADGIAATLQAQAELASAMADAVLE